MSSEAGPSRHSTAARPAGNGVVGSALAPPPPQDDGRMESSDDDDDDDDMVLDDRPPAPSSGLLPTAPASALDPTLPAFTPLSASQLVLDRKDEFRRVTIPLHRITPLKKEWAQIYAPLVEMVHLQVRFNMKRKCVELKTSKHTQDVGQIQKAADFIKAFALGFEVADAVALLRMDDLYVDTFEIKDVKTLHGDHLSRAIGRIAGHAGRTRHTIENASRTRIVLAETKIHILGTVQSIKIARDAVVSLILGSPPGKVYAGLRSTGARLKERF